MGICFSKKGTSSSSSASPLPVVVAAGQTPAFAKKVRTPGSPAPNKVPILQSKQGASGPQVETFVKKEVFVIKHRRSHDRDAGGRIAAASPYDSGEQSADGASKVATESAVCGLALGTGIRTSSCTKEEVESILIQCGRLSHSGSASGKPSAALSCPGSGGTSRRHSGSKRSYDFDHSNENEERARAGIQGACDDDDGEAGEMRWHRQLSRHLSGSQGSRRRTPSRERDQQRSVSAERRRVSRSPGKRSEITSASAASGGNDRPGKLVPVPATVPSSAEPMAQQTSSVRRISVKRNVGEGGRTAASPRSQSPVGAKEGPQQVALTVSRNSSRKAEYSPYWRNPSTDNEPSRKQEQSPYQRNISSDIDPSRKLEQSPYRRNPLAEIDQNVYSALASLSNIAPYINSRVQIHNQKQNEGLENINVAQLVMTPNTDPNSKKATQGTVSKLNYSDEIEKLNIGSGMQQVKATAAETDNQMQQKLTRSRSARRSSGHIDFNPEIPNPTSYTNLLLEDIQNFHQTNPASVSLPACVSKAHSIFQAVADLNNSSASNISSGLSDDKRAHPQPSFQFSSNWRRQRRAGILGKQQHCVR